MTDAITITTAPCCWGVDDVRNPNLPPWKKVLEEADAARFRGLELGPYGYLPLDVAQVAPVLDRHNLRVVAGTIFDDLVDPANRENLLRQTREICALVTALPEPGYAPGQRFRAPYLTVMDWGHDERDYAAGHSEKAERLNDERWADMVGNITAIAELARDEFGVRAVIHPHAGGHIEFADEIERIVEDVPEKVAGLCIDTGHTAYAGMDPVATLERYWSRIDYLHFKDIDPVVFADVMGRRIRFFDACAEGVMCPIGRGSIDYKAIYGFLRERGYAGFITIEQERDPRNADGVLADLRSSHQYLADIGFAYTE
ncbi:2-keto-myo-inositol dehydratase [Devosia sp. YR412]|uniref:TIM barrel protein n=1 Tax=Devosia sp. YR412 TaxID=1881030 RepID=UPI0008B1E3BC|nr:TIM barrel protein [Devosia sp. YR412]SEQ10114.1 2-keto-myo-inositol dehydratase [Devosia sp. YR412]